MGKNRWRAYLKLDKRCDQKDEEGLMVNYTECQIQRRTIQKSLVKKLMSARRDVGAALKKEK